MKQAMKEITALQDAIVDIFEELEDVRVRFTYCRENFTRAERKLARKLNELGLTSLRHLFDGHNRSNDTDTAIKGKFFIAEKHPAVFNTIVPNFTRAEYTRQLYGWNGVIYYPANVVLSDRDKELLSNPIFNWDIKLIGG